MYSLFRDESSTRVKRGSTCRKHVAFIFTFTVLNHHNVMKNKGEKMEKKLKRISRARSELLAEEGVAGGLGDSKIG